mgnify:FL=1
MFVSGKHVEHLKLVCGPPDPLQEFDLAAFPKLKTLLVVMCCIHISERSTFDPDPLPMGKYINVPSGTRIVETTAEEEIISADGHAHCKLYWKWA